MVENKGKTLYKSKEIEAVVSRLAEAIFKDAPPKKQLVLVGIAAGGVPFAERLSKRLIEKGRKPLFGILDITFYRDDLALREGHPIIQRTEISFNLDHTHVVLVDDVLYSGRTVRAAMDALNDFGRPDAIRLCVLADRGHRELPIQANFVGFTVETTPAEKVSVTWKELGDADDSVILRGEVK